MEEENPQNNFDEGGMQWRVKEPESFKEIVLRAIEKCRVEGSKQMVKGGTYLINHPKFGQIPMNIPDQREVYITSVRTLHDLLLYYFDDEATKKMEELNKKMSELEERYLQLFVDVEPTQRGKQYATQTKKIDTSQSHGKNIYEDLQQAILEDVWRKAFQELVLLFKRKNELSSKRTIGAY